MNSYLKEIADVCGIQKNLSTHIARHTFASLAIANKVSLESIAKMLGHTDIRTTRIYAKIMNSTIANIFFRQALHRSLAKNSRASKKLKYWLHGAGHV